MTLAEAQHEVRTVFLNGAFGILAGALLAIGFGLGFGFRDSFAAGGWLTAATLLAFSGWAAAAWRRSPAAETAHAWPG